MKKQFITGFVSATLIFGVAGVLAATFTATDNPFPVQLNGEDVQIEGYNIEGSTYFKLRDIADVVGGFDVGFQNDTIQLSKDGYVYDNSDTQNDLSEEKRNEFRAKMDEINDNLSKELEKAMDQRQLNAVAYSTYEKADALLNEIYQYLKDTLPEEEFALLEQDELNWIESKNYKMEEAASEYQGGSLETFMRYDAGLAVTEERCEYLITLIK